MSFFDYKYIIWIIQSKQISYKKHGHIQSQIKSSSSGVSGLHTKHELKVASLIT